MGPSREAQCDELQDSENFFSDQVLISLIGFFRGTWVGCVVNQASQACLGGEGWLVRVSKTLSRLSPGPLLGPGAQPELEPGRGCSRDGTCWGVVAGG